MEGERTYRVDIALVDGDGRVIAAVEIRESHAMEDEKRSGLSIPWVEVDAQRAIDDPLVLHPLCFGHLRPWQCWECKSGYVRQQVAAREQAENRRMIWETIDRYIENRNRAAAAAFDDRRMNTLISEERRE